MVKIAIIPNDLYEPNKNFESVIEMCNEENVKYIEIAFLWNKSVLDLNEDEVSKVHEILDQHGIKVASIQTQIMKVFPEGSKLAKKGSKNMHRDHDYNVSRIDDAIRMADEFNTRYIVTYSYFTYLTPQTGDIWEKLFKDYEILVNKCKSGKKTMVVECEGDTLVGTTSDYIKLFNHFKSPHLKANLDLANFVGHVGSFSRVDDFEKLKEHVEYFHVKDRLFKKSALKKLPLIGQFFGDKSAIFGEGNVPWREVIPWFIDSGFDGVFSIEPHVHGKGRFEKGRKCIQNLKSLLDELKVNYE
ncbi:MAG: sugar phosphate isomerase/epimerase family protein [Promethearchaeota archaeon]